jgi:hypothetical protein
MDRGKPGSKMNILSDADGLPRRFLKIAGQGAGRRAAEPSENPSKTWVVQELRTTVF